MSYISLSCIEENLYRDRDARCDAAITTRARGSISQRSQVLKMEQGLIRCVRAHLSALLSESAGADVVGFVIGTFNIKYLTLRDSRRLLLHCLFVISRYICKYIYNDGAE